ncbi:hypothetical protein PYCCODRAFT_255878 [Trametes coccinea BRFM310]|uniref:Uncharacterized protein n=1 Tax=Trametes coccinea (strain BRFM310) TaxID=1353009 RepID=A0A1Y2IRF9_TRAC3|nr:hypothetical protein PYCCODRAFT_255878 [Trametes coccinea BRFM310]
MSRHACPSRRFAVVHVRRRPASSTPSACAGASWGCAEHSLCLSSPTSRRPHRSARCHSRTRPPRRAAAAQYTQNLHVPHVFLDRGRRPGAGADGAGTSRSFLQFRTSTILTIGHGATKFVRTDVLGQAVTAIELFAVVCASEL